MRFKFAAIVLVLCGIALFAGCTEIEPRTGTRITFSLPASGVTREDIAATSRYLIVRARQSLDVERARTESVTKDSIIMLLPGAKIDRARADKLLESNSIELYHLDNVATDKHPDRPWKLSLPKQSGGAYIFTRANDEKIDSREQPRLLLERVVGAPKKKPILTGDDILPNATMQETKNGYAVLVQFDDEGSERFHQFTSANVGEYLAVFYNGKLISAPLVKSPIKGGEAFITGFSRMSQAQMAVSQLNAGKLPMRLKIKSVEHY